MQQKRFISVLLAVIMSLMTCVSSLTVFVNAIENIEEVALSQPMSTTAQTCLAMTVGSDENDRNFTWYFNSSESGYLDIAERNGNTFPSEYESYKSTVAYSSVRSCYYHRVSVYDLKPDTQYVYRLRNGNVISKNYYFETDPVDAFNFVFVGDPQIGASGSLGNDGTNWGKTVTAVNQMFPETSLLVLAGDQVELCNDEDAYDHFLSPSLLPSFAMARSIGNHESWYKFSDKYAQNYGIHKEHFFDPNTLTNGKNLGSTDAGCDYWYSYNNVLFMHINSNNRSTAEHEEFMKAAVAANPNAAWRVVVMHYALFGAHYYDDSLIGDKRTAFTPIFDELDVDVVLNGHEHLYARSYMMENNSTTPKVVSSSVKSVTDPNGILYITASSSSGSKYYGFLDDSLLPHIAYKAKNITTFSNIEVDKDSFKITTYNVSDKSVVDHFEIVKTNPKVMPERNNVAFGKTYTTSELNVKNGEVKYPDENGKTMTDGIYAPHHASYNHEAYIGFYKNDNDYVNNGYASITVDLLKNYDLDRFVSRVASDYNSAAGVYGPATMEIYISDDNVNFTKAGSVDVKSRSDISCMPIAVDLDRPVSARYVQYRYTIGSSVWLMVAEVQAFEAATPEASDDNLIIGKEYTTTKPNRNDGWDDDGSKLTDGKKSNPDGSKTVYSGWNSESVEILFDFETAQQTDTYTVYAAGGVWGIKLPKDVLSLEVYSSDNAESGFELVASAPVGSAELVSGTDKEDNTWSTYSLTASAKKAVSSRYIKLVIKHTPIETQEHIWIDEIEIGYKNKPKNILVGKEYELSGCGNRAKYYANLADGVAAFGPLDADRHTKWFGFYYNTGVAESDINAPNGVGYVIFDLGDKYSISKVRTNNINRTDWGIVAPTSINVYVSDDGVNWGSAVGTLAVRTDIDDVSYWTEISGNWEAKYLKVEYDLGGTFACTNEIEAYGVKVDEPDEPDEPTPDEPTPDDPDVMLGDVNGDKKVDSVDYLLVKRACFKTYTLDEEETLRADVNCDSLIDSTDYLLVKRIAFGTYVVK